MAQFIYLAVTLFIMLALSSRMHTYSSQVSVHLSVLFCIYSY